MTGITVLTAAQACTGALTDALGLVPCFAAGAWTQCTQGLMR